MRTAIVLLSTLILTAFGVKAQQNNGFEQWDTLSIINGNRYHDLIDWQTTNDYLLGINLPQAVTYTTDARSGQYAMRLNATVDEEGNQLSTVVSGKGFEGLDQAGDKFPLRGKPSKFGAWVKYQPDGLDSFLVMILFFKEGQHVGSGFLRSSQTIGTYQKVEQELRYYQGAPDPDSAKIIIVASAAQMLSNTYLIIDDVFVEYGTTTGIAQQENNLESAALYPNPVAGSLFISMKEPNNIQSAKVLTATGEEVAAIQLNTNGIDVSSLAPGIYYLQLTDKHNQVSRKKFIKQ